MNNIQNDVIKPKLNLRSVPTLELPARAKKELVAERARQQQGEDEQSGSLTSQDLWQRAQMLLNPPRGAFDDEESKLAALVAQQCQIDAFLLAINEHDAMIASSPTLDPRAIALWDRASAVEQRASRAARRGDNKDDTGKDVLLEAMELYRAATKICPEVENPEFSSKFVIPLRAEIPVRSIKLMPRKADTSSSSSSPLRLVHISDTHNEFYDIPQCDILIHSGDVVDVGSPAEVARLNHYLRTHVNGLKAKVFILVCGNHEPPQSVCLAKVLFNGLRYYEPPQTTPAAAAAEQVPDLLFDLYAQHKETIFVLLHDACVAVGGIVVGGSPWMSMGPFYEPNMDTRFKRAENVLSSSPDVLVTHIPPAGILDKAGFMPIGCHALLTALTTVPGAGRVVLHCFGHAHGGFGTLDSDWIAVGKPSEGDETAAAAAASSASSTNGKSYMKMKDCFKMTLVAQQDEAGEEKRRLVFSNAAIIGEREAVPRVFDLVW